MARSRAEIARLKAELQRRKLARAVSAAGSFTPEAVSAGHVPQAKLLQDQSRRVIALCSRRAGKSVAVCAKMAATALAYPESIVIYFGATGKAVKLLIWDAVWKWFTRKWGIEGKHNETLMMTQFPNGSRVIFAGTDDYAHVETFLGGKLRMVVIDEAQSQPDSVLRPLVIRILPPALSDLGGTLMMSGTIPDTPAGLFYETWKAERWSRHNWSRFDNPHIESKEELKIFLAESGLAEDDPIVRRDWFGEFVFSETATAYRYLASRNAYSPPTTTSRDFPPGLMLTAVAPAELEYFSIAADPAATHDRFAVVVWGWGRKSRDVWHVAEWVTEPAANALQSQWMAVMGELTKRYPGMCRWYYDAGSSQTTIDTVRRDYGIPVILPANKASLKGQVDRFADLLGSGRAHVIAGSALEEDLLKCRWDLDARAKGQWRWSSAWHGDVADAARYALQGYFDVAEAPGPDLNAEQLAAKLEAEALREVMQPPPAKEAWQSHDRILESLWFGGGGEDPGPT